MSQFLPDTDSENELDVNWEERANIDGQVYYVNHVTKSTQWTHPKTGKRKKLSGKMPINWTEQIAEDGTVTYVNTLTNRTTYTDPRLAFAVEYNANQHDLRQKFDSSATALQVLHGENLNNKLAIVTGANTGIGYETTRSLVLHGCHVVMACRDQKKTNDAIEKIRKERPNAMLSFLECDLSKLRSVKQFSEDFLSMNLPLHILILNAGVFALPEQFTEDNVELTFQVNHLAQMYLAELLRDRLIESKPSRVVVLSSESHRFSHLNKTNLIADKFTKPSKFFIPMMAYNDSKLCNLLFTHQFNMRYRNHGINVNACHPGNMISSDLSRNWWFYRILFFFVRPFTKSLQQGAATTVYCATSSDLNNITGCYFNNCTICEPSKSAKDDDLSFQLWKLSEKLIEDSINCNQ